jgi:GNAT superfamily N-acetyltransferase
MDAVEFLRRAEPLLMRDEARHNLILGIAATIVAHPDHYPDPRMWIGGAGGVPDSAALITPPHNLVLADALNSEAIGALIELVAADAGAIPGVTGNRPTVDWFIDRWVDRFGVTPILAMSQGVFSLEAVNCFPRVEGRAQRANATSRSLALEWVESFSVEALPEPHRGASRLERALDLRLGPDLDSGLWLWMVHERPVAMAGYGGETPNGVRVGPVYTPPDLRGRGYATALVASLSQWLLTARGRTFCFLYTDLSNPTSNEIYRRIGYRQVAESAEYRFS